MADPELQLVAAVDPLHAGIDLRGVTGAELRGLQVSPDLESLVRAEAQVAVDFTHIEAARANLAWCADNGVHAVVGTTGFMPEDYEELATRFTRSNCFVAPNFAIGAVLMMRFAELAAPYFETAEIIELHHDQKVDAPSGTAMLTAERMAAGSSDWAADPRPSRWWRAPGAARPPAASASTRSASGAWSPTRRCCWAPPARACRSGTTPTTGRHSCPVSCSR